LREYCGTGIKGVAIVGSGANGKTTLIVAPSKNRFSYQNRPVKWHRMLANLVLASPTNSTSL